MYIIFYFINMRLSLRRSKASFYRFFFGTKHHLGLCLFVPRRIRCMIDFVGANIPFDETVLVFRQLMCFFNFYVLWIKAIFLRVVFNFPNSNSGLLGIFL